MLVWVFWLVDRQVFFGEPVKDDLAAVTVLIVQVLAGFAVGRFWALLLPAPLVLIAIPLGYPSTNLGEPLPTWFGLLIFSPVLVIGIAAGIGGRVLWDRLGQPKTARKCVSPYLQRPVGWWVGPPTKDFCLSTA